MQHTPDKEFDKLFKDRFEDAEIEPSANLWANIESRLAPKRKRVFPIYWMAAASVAIVITAMLVFQKEDVIELRGKDQLANVVTPTVQLPEKSTSPVAITVVATTKAAKPRFASPRKGANNTSGTEASKKENLINIQEAVQPKEEFTHLPIKKADPIKLDVTLPKEPAVQNQTVIAQLDPQKTVETPADELDNTTERKGIRNVGDLVNYVVEKVDKREKKILKFKTDDDDESSLIGINIGFVKLNRKHK